MIRIAIILGSTRPGRNGEAVAKWVHQQASQRTDAQYELVDLKDFDLPFFNEAASNLWMPSSDPKAVAWQNKIGEFDGFIVVAAEYNRSITGALKNALDQAYVEWARKPMTAIAYGSMGGARALEHLRNIAVELQMVPTRNAVHIGGGDFWKVHPGMGGSGNIADIEAAILPSAGLALDDLVWWANATKAARG